MGSHQKKVLVIDQANPFFYLLELMLKRLGYTAVHARTGIEGLGVARITQPDLVITEWRLPDLTGPDLLRSLIPGNREESSPVIVISTDSRPENHEEAKRHGAVAFLAKPLSVRSLYLAMEDHLERRRRKYIRLPMALLVAVEEEGKTVTVPTETFGEAGMYLKTFQPSGVGTRLNLKVHFPAREEPLPLRGEVVYSVPPPSRDRHPGMGIRFVEVEPSLQEYLGRFMEEKLTEPPPAPFRVPRLTQAWA